MGKCKYDFCKKSTVQMVGNGLVAHDIYDGSRHCSWVRLLCFPVQFGYTKYRQDSSSNLSSISHQRKAPTVFWMSHVSLNFGLSLSCPSWTRPRCKLFVKDPHDNVVHASTPLLACHNHHLVKSKEIKSAGKSLLAPVNELDIHVLIQRPLCREFP